MKILYKTLDGATRWSETPLDYHKNIRVPIYMGISCSLAGTGSSYSFREYTRVGDGQDDEGAFVIYKEVIDGKSY